MFQVPALVKYENGCFHFVDGTRDSFDVVMFCTGLQHNFPFLMENLKVPMKNLLWIDGLYKGSSFSHKNPLKVKAPHLEHISLRI